MLHMFASSTMTCGSYIVSYMHVRIATYVVIRAVITRIRFLVT